MESLIETTQIVMIIETKLPSLRSKMTFLSSISLIYSNSLSIIRSQARDPEDLLTSICFWAVEFKLVNKLPQPSQEVLSSTTTGQWDLQVSQSSTKVLTISRELLTTQQTQCL